MTTRPGWDAYFLGIAEAVSKRGDCTRRQVGAVIVDQNKRIISTGYNGTIPGQLGCLDGTCPRGRHYPVPMFEGDDGPGMCFTCEPEEWPCSEAVPSGSSYDTGPGACIALHAEQNALLYAFRDVAGMHMYLTTEPCGGCLKLLRGARLKRVVTPTSVLHWGLP